MLAAGPEGPCRWQADTNSTRNPLVFVGKDCLPAAKTWQADWQTGPGAEDACGGGQAQSTMRITTSRPMSTTATEDEQQRGNLLTTTNAEGNVTTNVYNGDDRFISATVATSSGTVNSSVAYTYDADGKVLTTTDGDGNVTTNSWDGNLLRRRHGHQCLGNDGRGHLLQL